MEALVWRCRDFSIYYTLDPLRIVQLELGASGEISQAEVPELAELVRQLRAYFAGSPEVIPLTSLEVTAMPRFQREILLALYHQVPRGKVTTYGGLAKLAGHPGASRAVGTALGRNPFAPVIPCHRVVCTDRTLGGFSAGGGLELKRRLLAMEGVVIGPDGKVAEELIIRGSQTQQK